MFQPITSHHLRRGAGYFVVLPQFIMHFCAHVCRKGEDTEGTASVSTPPLKHFQPRLPSSRVAPKHYRVLPHEKWMNHCRGHVIFSSLVTPCDNDFGDVPSRLPDGYGSHGEQIKENLNKNQNEKFSHESQIALFKCECYFGLLNRSSKCCQTRVRRTARCLSVCVFV